MGWRAVLATLATTPALRPVCLGVPPPGGKLGAPADPHQPAPAGGVWPLQRGGAAERPRDRKTDRDRGRRGQRPTVCRAEPTGYSRTPGRPPPLPPPDHAQRGVRCRRRRGSLGGPAPAVPRFPQEPGPGQRPSPRALAPDRQHSDPAVPSIHPRQVRSSRPGWGWVCPAGPPCGG